jgi:hypothetical protein
MGFLCRTTEYSSPGSHVKFCFVFSRMSHVKGSIATERGFSFLATCNRTQINNCTHKKKEFRDDQNFETMMITAKQRSSHQFFMDLLLIGAWNIWKQRNGLIFNKMLHSIAKRRS